MLDFITRFFKREEASKTLAKERLRLVLMSDRVSLAPEAFDEMKGEILSVIRRYLEIDERSLDLHFENLERQFALLASIPVLAVKPPDETGRWREPIHAPQPAVERTHEAAALHSAVATVAPIVEQSANGSVHGPQPRRRRRRRKSQTAAQQELPPS